LLCLQETKCPTTDFRKRSPPRLRAHRAQRPEGLSRRGDPRLPFESFDRSASAARPTAPVACWRAAGLRDPVTLHNFYVPPAATSRSEINPKFAHKLASDEMRALELRRAQAPHDSSAISTSRR
jgi:hypothetical protein